MSPPDNSYSWFITPRTMIYGSLETTSIVLFINNYFFLWMFMVLIDNISRKSSCGLATPPSGSSMGAGPGPAGQAP